MNSYLVSTLVLLVLCAVLTILWVHALDMASARRRRDGAQPLPTACQVRSWRRDRLVVSSHNRQIGRGRGKDLASPDAAEQSRRKKTA